MHNDTEKFNNILSALRNHLVQFPPKLSSKKSEERQLHLQLIANTLLQIKDFDENSYKALLAMMVYIRSQIKVEYDESKPVCIYNTAISYFPKGLAFFQPIKPEESKTYELLTSLLPEDILNSEKQVHDYLEVYQKFLERDDVSESFSSQGLKSASDFVDVKKTVAAQINRLKITLAEQLSREAAGLQ